MKQIIFNLPESTSSTQTHIVTVPKLKEIVSSLVNTGQVIIKAVAADKVTLEVKGGNYHRSEYAGGSYTPGDSKYLTDYPGYEDVYTTYYKKQGANWVYWKQVKTVTAQSSYYYNSGGFSGTLSRTGNDFLSNTVEEALPPTTDGYYEGEGYSTSWVYYSQEYGGTVTSPSSDNRYYNYYYKYNVTINYEEKGFNLRVKKDGALKKATEGWVKVGGVLKPIENIHTKVNGVLKEV